MLPDTSATTRRWLPALAAISIILAGCSPEEPTTGFDGLDEPAAAVSPSEDDAAPDQASPSPSPEATAPDITIVPTTVDEAYTQQVLDELFASSGALVAEVLATAPNGVGALPSDTASRVAQLFERGGYDFAYAELESFAATEEARAGLLPADQFAGIRHDVVALRFAGPNCVIAVTRAETSGSVPGGGPLDMLSAVSLVRHEGDVDRDANPTPWRIAGTLSNEGPDGTPNPDEVMLEASLEDFDGVLANDCTEEDARAT